MTTISRSRHNHLPTLHPDWLPPVGWHDPADDERDSALADPCANDAMPASSTSSSRAESPAECNSTAFPPTTPPVPANDPAADDARQPINSLDHETIAREIRDDPALAREMRADPWLAAQIADLIGPQPRPFRLLSKTIDPARAEPPGDPAASTTTALPLRERIYTLHCQGHSRLAIARALQLDRGTVARHLAAVQVELAEEHHAALLSLRARAVDAQFAILASAWDALAREEAHETEWLANARIPYPPTDTKIVPYRAQRARLLAIAAHAARTAAQLQGLFTPIALQAALRAVLTDALPDSLPDSLAAVTPPAAVPTSDPPAAAASATHAGLPAAFNSTSGSSTTPATPIPTVPQNSAASCGMPASDALLAAPASGAGLPVAFNSTDRSSIPPPAAASATHAGLPVEFNSTDRSSIPPTHPFAPANLAESTAATCGMPASDAASASPSPHRGTGLAVGSAPV